MCGNNDAFAPHKLLQCLAAVPLVEDKATDFGSFVLELSLDLHNALTLICMYALRWLSHTSDMDRESWFDL